MESITNYLVLSLLGLVFLKGINGADWEYTGTHGSEHWGQTYPKCSNKKQSPIDIETEDTMYKSGMDNIVFTGYDSNNLGLMLVNNGHAAQVNVENGSASISGGGFNGESYKLEQFHFHWGGSSGQGSEHTVNGHAYDAELHFVHYDAVHDDIGTAAETEPEGLAVLGVFIKIGQYDNPAYKHITDHLNQITLKGSKHVIPPFQLKTLLPEDTKSFFRYQGSLTTPPCHESVTWTVFNEPVTISKVQMDAFRSIVKVDSGIDKIVDNYRPVQDLNDRTVYVSQTALVSGATSLSGLTLAYFLAIAFTLLYKQL